MERIIKSLCKFTLLAFFFIQYGYAIEAKPSDILKTLSSAREIQTIMQRGKLIVAMTEGDNPPFYMVDKKGNLIGHDVDLAKLIAQKFGVQAEFNRNNATFDDVISRVAKGEADIGLSKLSLTLGRAQVVRYTKPYIILHKAFLLNRVGLTKRGSNLSLEELFSKKTSSIGVIRQSSYQEFALQMFPQATVSRWPSWSQDIVPKVIKGEILGAFRDELVVRRTMLTVPDAALYLLAVIIKDEPDPLMMVVNKNSDVLQQWLNVFLDYYYPKYNIESIINKYKPYVYNADASP